MGGGRTDESPGRCGVERAVKARPFSNCAVSEIRILMTINIIRRYSVFTCSSFYHLDRHEKAATHNDRIVTRSRADHRMLTLRMWSTGHRAPAQSSSKLEAGPFTLILKLVICVRFSPGVFLSIV